MRKICVAILLVPALAWGQQKSADQWYREGANHYNLGNFDKAVEAFKEGFAVETDESKKPAYLYNVAQAYRQANDCERALFFYKRFLALKDGDTVKPLPAKTRKEVVDWITELETCVQKAAAISKKPPNTNLPPDGEKPDTAAATPSTGDPAASKTVAAANSGPGGDDDDTGAIEEPAPAERPRVISLRLTGGGTKVSAGMFKVPVQATFALVGGYPIAINDRLTIDAGAAFTFTPVPYDMNTAPGMPVRSKTATLTALMVNGGATYEVLPRISVRGDVGAGALFFSNVNASQFTNFQMTSGALSMFHLRLAASADYAFTPNIIGTITPFAFTYSPPKKGLDPSIKQITSIDFMLGIGYRM